MPSSSSLIFSHPCILPVILSFLHPHRHWSSFYSINSRIRALLPHSVSWSSAPGKVILFGEHSVVFGRAAVATAASLRTTTAVFIPLFNNIDNNIDNNKAIVTLHLSALHEQLRWSLSSLQSIISSSLLLLTSSSSSLNLPSPYHPPDDPQQLSHFHPFISRLRSLVSPINTRYSDAIVAFLFLYCCMIRAACPVTVCVSSSIPVGAGMGSSAAFGVSMAAALSRYRHLGEYNNSNNNININNSIGSLSSPLPKDIINRWAYIVDTLIHGGASGIDNTVSTYGGALQFRRRPAAEGGVQMRSVQVARRLRLLVTDTLVPRNTKAVCARVAMRRSRHPAVMERILDAMESTALAAVEELEHNTVKGDGEHDQYNNNNNNNIGCNNNDEYESEQRLGELISMNHGMLNTIGAGHTALDKVVAESQRHGMAAKTTGAGGGGCAYTLVGTECTVSNNSNNNNINNNENENKTMNCNDEPSVTALRNTLEQNYGYRVWDVEIGGPGVRHSRSRRDSNNNNNNNNNNDDNDIDGHLIEDGLKLIMENSSN